jgi:hypothetical protein
MGGSTARKDKDKIMRTSFAAPLATFTLAFVVGACAPNGAQPRVASATTASASSLDGRTFDVVGEVPAGSNHPTKADIAFVAGKLDASTCREQGLPPVPYTLESDGSFYAERRTADGLDTWTGRVTGERIEGTFVATKGGATVMRIPFRGQGR